MQGITQNETNLLTALEEIINNSQDNFKRMYLDGDPIVELGKKYYEELSITGLIGFKQTGKHITPVWKDNKPIICPDSLDSKFQQMLFDFCN